MGENACGAPTYAVRPNGAQLVDLLGHRKIAGGHSCVTCWGAGDENPARYRDFGT